MSSCSDAWRNIAQRFQRAAYSRDEKLIRFALRLQKAGFYTEVEYRKGLITLTVRKKK